MKKIPYAILSRCEWGRDDYSLAIAKLPTVERDAEPQEGGKDGGQQAGQESARQTAAPGNGTKPKRTAAAAQPTLFGDGEA